MNREQEKITAVDRLSREKWAALYARLSRDDDNEGDSNSISHHIEILTKYAKEHGIDNFKIYKDDGFSGTNFNRPGFQQMLEDGSLRFSTIEEAKSFGYETQEEIFGLLLNGEVGYESLYKNLLDSDGRIAFTSFWLYDGYMVEETYKPLGVSNLVELVNTDPRWNG